MKIVALGVTQGHRLRFVAEGDDAKQAIEALGKIIASGLGGEFFHFINKHSTWASV